MTTRGRKSAPHIRMRQREVIVDWQRTNVPHEARRSRVVLHLEYEDESDIPAILAARHDIRYPTDIRIFNVSEAPEEVA